MVFVVIKASLLGGKPSFPFGNFNSSEPSLKDIAQHQLGGTQSEIQDDESN
jgi:hypothetical protein